MQTPGHYQRPHSRRDFLRRAGAGFGSVALMSLLANDAASNAAAPRSRRNPLAAKKSHFPGTAKSIIWCFLDGGPSHIDLFDPKPTLNKLAGKPLPDSFERPVTSMGSTANTPLLASQRKFKQHGQSGLWVSDWYPEIASCADDLCVVRSCVAEGQTHVGGVCQMNTGTLLPGRPSLGSWALYGLGSESENLPGFVVLTDYTAEPPGGSLNWGTGFMPATFQGTRLASGDRPFLDIAPSSPVATIQQRGKLDFIQRLNRKFSDERPEDDKLEARIQSYELAYRMQAAAPEAVDLTSESAETLRLYGIDKPETEKNGRNCLLARRFVERGVRCVQLYMGAGSKWDAHSDVEDNHSTYCLESDRPIAGLLKDLKRRGLLDSTLVIWGGEFGRTPMSESGKGRDHNPFGFTMWMAGGGVKPGMVYGATDEIGLYAVEDKAHLHDIHATILHLLGLNHEELIYQHNGREERLTVTEGNVIDNILL